MPLCRLGPPPRSFADDAYDCIMVTICKRIDRIQGCGVTSAPRWQAPLGSVVPDLQTARRLMSVKGRGPTIAIHRGLEQRRMTFVRRGNNYDGSDRAFAVKPRAFGAPQAALGLDRSAQPSKGLSMPQMQSGDVTK
jgi:hypothetical protein